MHLKIDPGNFFTLLSWFLCRSTQKLLDTPCKRIDFPAAWTHTLFPRIFRRRRQDRRYGKRKTQSFRGPFPNYFVNSADSAQVNLITCPSDRFNTVSRHSALRDCTSATIRAWVHHTHPDTKFKSFHFHLYLYLYLLFLSNISTYVDTTTNSVLVLASVIKFSFALVGN